MRRALMFVGALLLAGCVVCMNGCTSPPKVEAKAAELKAAPQSGGFGTAIGTLATWGTFEEQTAPLHTRLAVQSRNATTAYQQGRLSYASADLALDEAEAALKHLTSATNADAAKKWSEAQHQLRLAREALDRMASLIQGGRK